MVSNTHYLLPATHCLYILYFDRGKGGVGGGGLNQREGYRDNSLQSWVENTNRLYLQSITSDKHLPQSPSYRLIIIDDDILLWCLYS